MTWPSAVASDGGENDASDHPVTTGRASTLWGWSWPGAIPHYTSDIFAAGKASCKHWQFIEVRVNQSLDRVCTLDPRKKLRIFDSFNNCHILWRGSDLFDLTTTLQVSSEKRPQKVICPKHCLAWMCHKSEQTVDNDSLGHYYLCYT